MPTPTTAPTRASVTQLRAAVENMDSLSQDGFYEIAAIAKLALSSLNTNGGTQHLDQIVIALRAIWGKADISVDCIGYEAEQVGCASESVLTAFWQARSQAHTQAPKGA